MSQQSLLDVLLLCTERQGTEQLRVVGCAAVVQHVRQLQRLRASTLPKHLWGRRLRDSGAGFPQNLSALEPGLGLRPKCTLLPVAHGFAIWQHVNGFVQRV